MTDQQSVQHLPAPPDGTRVETGPVQFGDDKPGLFVRGGAAFDLSAHLRRLGELLAGHSDPAVAGVLDDLTRIADVIDRGVIAPASPGDDPIHPIEHPTREQIDASFRALAAARAKAAGKPARPEDIVGNGKGLWDSDEEFEQFLESIGRGIKPKA